MSKRVNYGSLPDVIDIPDLISVQLESFNDFLQSSKTIEGREDVGLKEAFKEVFPIESFDKSCMLSFVSYELGLPKKSMVDCLKDGDSFSVPLHAIFRLDNKNAQDGKGEIIEDRVYLGDIPKMTDRATFVINGAERVIISQLHRTPGICFESSKSTTGRTLYSYRLIPDRGSWMEVQYDKDDLMYIYLDRRRRRRKFLISTFLRSLKYETNRELLDVVYGIEKQKLTELAKDENLTSKYSIEDIVNAEGDIVAKGLEPLSPVIIEALKEMGEKSTEFVDTLELGNSFIINLDKDPSVDADDALKTIYKKMRPGDPASTANAKQLLKRLFFDMKHYDLGYVGRYKINQKLKINVDLNARTLQAEDIVAATKYIMRLKTTKGRLDDIDHLGSRRVRTVGELVQNQIRVGLARTERLIRERMTLFDMESDTMTPAKLINPKALQSVIREFFGRSQLS
ncbi:MAG: DNA-directed RNA polymerase subunit beta, partial [Lentisphaeraceae bacterium]|nr:DNA-directed RNA polymerase subunit beta [Lentisphaeraceae bacterium]